jgi:predicted ester cyclase
MSADIKTMVTRIFKEGMNKRNLSVFDEVLHKDFVNYSFPDSPPGPEGFKGAFNVFAAGFPDLQITTEDIFADGVSCATRGHFTGTHNGEFMGISPTGKPVNVKFIDMWKIKDGKLRESWVVMDIAGLMQQIGPAASAK